MTNVTVESSLAGVIGGKTATAIEKAFGYETVGALLEHYPRRYSSKGELTPISGLPVGEHVSVVAQVIDVRERKMVKRRGSILEAQITDGQGSLTLTWFNQAWRARDLKPGMRGVFAGKVGRYRDTYQLTHPDYELFEDTEDSLAAGQLWAKTPIPLYPSTAALPSWVTAKAIGVVLDALQDVPDPLPQQALQLLGPDAIPLRDAYELVHRPTSHSDWRSARKSLKFREAFLLQLALLDSKRNIDKNPAVKRQKQSGGLVEQLDASLPFSLTQDQIDVGDTVSRELEGDIPMHRLLQGEVGSGKTLVALRAMLQVVDSGGQAALLAPTEVLASQHFRSIAEFLGEDLTARVGLTLLTGQQRVAERKRASLAVASGAAKIVVGTHALMSETTLFSDLGLVVIDEQHRFGVEQREALRSKGATPPHLLVMTATPIPRTVALTAFGDLEVSTIKTLPPGRSAIETHAVPLREHPSWGDRAWVRAAEEIDGGRQVYVVCPAISPRQEEQGQETVEVIINPHEADEETARSSTLANVEDTVAELRNHPSLRQARIEGLTGVMSADEKDAVMTAFASGEIDLLVATTVIEVGVNVPNASLMIVRDAERFGISQLHQLRGRVGRGTVPGLCLLLTNAEAGTPARERIEAVAATGDGFVLAEIDLEHRREGDILGAAQSGGKRTLKLLEVVRDTDLIVKARTAVENLLQEDPDLQTAPLLRARLTSARREQGFDYLAKS